MVSTPLALPQVAFAAVTASAVGLPFTTTVVVPAALVHPPTVTVTLYVPAIAAVANGRVGSSSEELKEAGPVQL